MMNFAGRSQTTDTICIPIEQARKIMSSAKQRDILLEQVSILNERIALYQDNIRLLNEKDSVTVAGHKKELAILEDQKLILLQTIADKNKELRRERRKRIVTGGLGILATAAAFLIGMGK